MNDEGWWFQAVEGFCRQTNKQTDICDCRVTFATENVAQKIYLRIKGDGNDREPDTRQKLELGKMAKNWLELKYYGWFEITTAGKQNKTIRK